MNVDDHRPGHSRDTPVTVSDTLDSDTEVRDDDVHPVNKIHHQHPLKFRIDISFTFPPSLHPTSFSLLSISGYIKL